MATKPLVVIGSANADLVFTIQRLPLPGETLAASSLETIPGGKGANQSAAAARLACPTFFVGQVGSDANAAMLKGALEGCGVDVSHLRAVEGPTGTALILLQESGENSIVIVGGANHFDWQVSDGLQQLVKGAGAILLQREIPEAVNLQVAKAAHAAGVRVVLDAGGADGVLEPALLPCLDILSPNETELARLTGMPTDSLAQVEEAAQKLMQQGVKSVLVKLGADGSLLLPGPGQPAIRQNAIKAPTVVDTTGAGDCFTAAFTVALLEGKDSAQALRFASAAGSLCVRRKGAIPSMPSRTEVDALLAEE